jgi:hypothetical protein
MLQCLVLCIRECINNTMLCEYAGIHDMVLGWIQIQQYTWIRAEARVDRHPPLVRSATAACTGSIAPEAFASITFFSSPRKRG